MWYMLYYPQHFNSDVLLLNVTIITSTGIMLNNTQEYSSDIISCNVSSGNYILEIFYN